MWLKLGVIILFIISLSLQISFAKVNNFGTQFPELVNNNPSQKWLIKFYAPWCHHCQQLEPTYVKVSEILHHNHDNIVVGRVDCTLYQTICRQYGVEYFPSIFYIDQRTYILYQGDRSVEGIVEFAERLSGPDVNSVESCNQLKGLPSRHNVVILSKEKNVSSELHTTFKSLASKLKPNYWFYHFTKTCDEFSGDQGLYLLKRHLNYPIKFKYDPTSDDSNLENKIKHWISIESIPVYGRLSSGNIDSMLASNKTLVVSILDEYGPARKLVSTSKTFQDRFMKFAQKVSKQKQEGQDILFAWSTDLDLIQSIVLGQIQVPNVIVLKNDLSYHLLIVEPTGEDIEKTILLKLREERLDKLVHSIEGNKLKYEGGNSTLRYMMRKVYSITSKMISLYRSNPLLASLLIGMPSLILVIVIYTTCFYDASYSGDDEEGKLLRSDSDEDGEEDDEVDSELEAGNLKHSKHCKQD